MSTHSHTVHLPKSAGEVVIFGLFDDLRTVDSSIGEFGAEVLRSETFDPGDADPTDDEVAVPTPLVIPLVTVFAINDAILC